MAFKKLADVDSTADRSAHSRNMHGSGESSAPVISFNGKPITEELAIVSTYQVVLHEIDIFCWSVNMFV